MEIAWQNWQVCLFGGMCLICGVRLGMLLEEKLNKYYGG